MEPKARQYLLSRWLSNGHELHVNATFFYEFLIIWKPNSSLLTVTDRTIK